LEYFAANNMSDVSIDEASNSNLTKQLEDVTVQINQVDEEIQRLEQKKNRLEAKRQKLVELKQKNEYKSIAGQNWESKGNNFHFNFSFFYLLL
jgi:predicted nuclease with TOPRIM domain